MPSEGAQPNIQFRVQNHPSLPTPASAFNSGAVTARSEPRYRPSFGGYREITRVHGGASCAWGRWLGRFDQLLAEQFGYFLQRLHETPEGDGTLLDHTLVLDGSSNSRTHQNRNYPLVLARGTGMGLKHGHYRRYGNDVSCRTSLSRYSIASVYQSRGLPTARPKCRTCWPDRDNGVAGFSGCG